MQYLKRAVKEIFTPFNLLVFFAILLYLFTFTYKDWYLEIPDLRYLYNRASQMYDCLQNGDLPFYYYNDLEGAGYGSSFFYGHLTLYPFLFLVPMGMETFLNVYALVTYILVYYGIQSLSKRYTENYREVSLLTFLSFFMIRMLGTNALYPNFFAWGISFFLIASAVDFLRDNKSPLKTLIWFFLLVNSHVSITFITFLVCLVCFVKYFDKTRLKDYFKFGMNCLLVGCYSILNVVYHSDILTRTDDIILEFSKKKTSVVNYVSELPIFGMIGHNLTNGEFSAGFGLLNIPVFIIGLILLFRRRKRIKKSEIIFIILSVCGIVLANKQIWEYINANICIIPFQFPSRYMIYIVWVLILIMYRSGAKKLLYYILIFGCATELFILPACITGVASGGISYYSDYMVNGDYLDESFEWDIDKFNYRKSHVYDSESNEYEFTVDKNKVTAYIPEVISDTVVTFPKLYYKGFKYEGSVGKSSKEFKGSCIMGESQFVAVPVDIFKGELTIEYKHSWLGVVDFSCIGYLFYLIFKEFKRKRESKN